MNKYAFTTLAFALSAISFTATANHPYDNRYDDDYYQNGQYDDRNESQYTNDQNYNYDNGNYGYIHSGRYYSYDQYNPYDQGRYVKAKVVRVVPITLRVSSAGGMVCQPVAYPYNQNQAYGSNQSKPIINAGSVTGALIGGAIGNQVADYPNKSTGTLVGAAIGGLVGNAIAQKANDNYRGNVQSGNCYAAPGRYAVQTVGYDVTYRYKGNNYLVRMPYYPEKHIRIRLDNINYYPQHIAGRY